MTLDHGGFDQVESLSIAPSDSDSQEYIEDYAPGDTEVGEKRESNPK